VTGRCLADYRPADRERAVGALLSVAEMLGDLMSSDLTVVGGLVPALIVPQPDGSGPETHCGTLDVDLGLSLALPHQRRYAEVSARLRQAGFRPTTDGDGEPVPYRWRTPDHLSRVSIDFLIARRCGQDPADDFERLERDLVAVRTPGLQLVARDWVLVSASGIALEGAPAVHEVRVCGPGAFAVLKARALRGRSRPKDAYDLTYVLERFPGGVAAVAEALRPLLDDPDAQEAVAWLGEDFARIDSAGPVRAAEFVQGGRDDVLQADARGLVRELLRLIG